MPKYLVLLFVALAMSASVWSETTLDAKHLGVVFNNDINNILHASTGKEIFVEEYRCAVNRIPDPAPGVLAQNVDILQAQLSGDPPQASKQKMHAIEIIAHRGANRLAPENTKASAQKCIDLGVDYLEVDSLLSKDHVHYNLHDFTLSRTTNGKGLLSAFPSSVVDTLDAGSWFGPEFAGERVPRLDTLVPWLKGKIKINFDVKFADLDVLIKLIRDTHFEQECFLHFASPVMALRCHELAPDLILKVDVGTPEEAANAATVYHASIVETQLASLTPAFRETLRKYGLKLILCAVDNDEAEYRRIIAANPDMVMLDAPDLFLKVLEEKK